jgi:phospholipid transport system substrate-binding protein
VKQRDRLQLCFWTERVRPVIWERYLHVPQYIDRLGCLVRHRVRRFDPIGNFELAEQVDRRSFSVVFPVEHGARAILRRQRPEDGDKPATKTSRAGQCIPRRLLLGLYKSRISISKVAHMKPKFLILLCALFFAPAADSAYAADSDPAAIQVQTLTTSLLKSMRAGPAASTTERYRILEPGIEQVFALPLMTHLSVGPEWANFSAEQQQTLIAAFTRYTIANYAYNFRDFNGQKFEIDNVSSRGEEKVVSTRLIPPDDTPTSLLYRMREVGGIWKIVDVYSDGISELTLRRSDFAAAIASGGAPVLTAHLNKVSDDLMK